MHPSVALLTALAMMFCGMATQVWAADPVIKVTVLGSGTPIPLPDRFGPSTLVEAGSQKMLFDAGRGVPIRLYQLGVRIGGVSPLFITHLHSDHVLGIPDVWLTGWLGAPWGRRSQPLSIVGPVGTKELADNLQKAYAADIRIRIADEKYPPKGAELVASEYSADGVVYDKDGVRVSAFEVDHGDAIKPAYGYRIEYGGRSVVLSGDTRLNENVIKNATGADLLLHEVAAAPPQLQADAQVQRVMAHHTSPEQAGTVFARAQPHLAVFTHMVLSERPNAPALSMDEVVAQTRRTYQGPLQVAEDLMTFEVDQQGTVTVRQPAEQVRKHTSFR